jgi:hypothetical protein
MMLRYPLLMMKNSHLEPKVKVDSIENVMFKLRTVKLLDRNCIKSHLVRHGISTHTPTWRANYRQNIVSSPLRGMPTMVD